MKNKQALVLLLCIIVQLTLAPSVLARTQKVLVLHSYHQGLQWTDSISAGIQSVFYDRSLDFEVYYEYLDTKRNQGEDYSEKLLQLFKAKENLAQFDLIITVDNKALEFVKLHGEQFFPNAPVVFCGINFFENTLIEGINQVTGVVEKGDFKATLNLMLQVHPNTNKIVVLVDNTETGRAIREDMQGIAPYFAGRVNLETLHDFTWDSLTDHIATLNSGTLVFAQAISRDKNNHFISYFDAIELLRNSSKVPIYGSWDFYMGRGLIGGVLTSGFMQGELAAKIASRILNGETADSIPIVHDVPTKVVFDYTQMQRHGVELHQLPIEAEIINKPKGLLERLVPYLGGIALLLLIVLAGMGYTIIIQRTRQALIIKSNRALDQKVQEKTQQFHQINERLTTLIDTLPTPVYQTSTANRIEACNDTFAKSCLGIPKEAVIGSSERKLKERVPEVVFNSLALFDPILHCDNLVPPKEKAIISVDGKQRDYMCHSAPISDLKGNVIGHITAMMDVTEQRNNQREKERLIADLELANQKLNDLASIDMVTSVYNRRHISMRLSEEVSQAKRHKSNFCILMLDIDHFKAVNDRFGHQMGDEVLQRVCKTIKSAMRKEDVLGRYGGEEFLLILPRTEIQDARLLAERIRLTVQGLTWQHKQGLQLTISIGVSSYQNQTEFELINQADNHLYAAKIEGRNRVRG